MLSFWIGLSLGCIILLACGNIEHFRIKPHDPASTSSSKVDIMMADIDPRSVFVNRFSRALQSSQIADGADELYPFIIQEGKVLCKKTHREKIRNSKATARSRHFVEMIQNAMAYWSSNKNVSAAHSLASPRLLPILLLNGDGTGCDITKREDGLNHPRLTWSVPSLAHGHGWCNAFGMTSYQAWRNFNGDHVNPSSWKTTFEEQSTKYPWSLKLDKAVWRGSSTAARHYQSRSAKGEWLPRKSGDLITIPRERLVRKSIEYPELIDASFTKIDGRVLNETRLTKKMEFKDQMKYKAILDIDGNGWSSRFPMLLCTNSVVIKIEPDFIEPFYHNLKPMIHYVPASIDNVTQVVSMVLHKDNDDEMQAIVNAANSWCMMEMTKPGMARDTLLRLEEYGQSIRESVLEGSLNISDIAEDLEECSIEGRPKKRGKGKKKNMRTKSR